LSTYRLNKYAVKRLARLSALLGAAAISDDLENFHQIRLEIKKIKAVLSLLGFADIRFDARKSYLPLRDIFRTAGEIRGPIGLGKLLAQNGVDAQQVRAVAASSRQSVRKFRRSLPAFRMAVAELDIAIEATARAPGTRLIHAYLRSLEDSVRANLFPRMNRAELHRSRKLIKQIIYLAPLSTRRKNPVPSFYSETEEAIGQWHDTRTVIDFLKNQEQPNPELVARLEKTARQELRKLRKDVTAWYQGREDSIR